MCFLSPGIAEQGLYRVVGVGSKVKKLLDVCFGKKNFISTVNSLLADTLYIPGRNCHKLYCSNSCYYGLHAFSNKHSNCSILVTLQRTP